MVTCPYCGTENRASAAYCNYCGGAVHAPSGAAPGTSSTWRASNGPSHHATGRLPSQARLARHYLILKTVGQGGMAAVYQASDTRTRRSVAIKEMSQDGLTPDEVQESLASFRFEADTLKRLRHPNLPRVYERFAEGTRQYLVMDFIEGQTLEQRQAAAGGVALPEAEVMRWASQLCAVLTYLHSQRPPIIFRDLKPANVMLTPEGQIKLIDFGIARVFAPGRSRDTQVLGTPGFAPPEQYGKSQTDARADVYALACTLYQLLSGYDPATTPFALPPLHTRVPHLAPHIQVAIERATRLDREGRYASMDDFARALLRPDALYFRSGEAAHGLGEALALCRRFPQEGEDHLYSGRLAGWLHAWGERPAAAAAASAVARNANHAAGLRAFLAGATAPSAPAPQAQPRTTTKHSAAPPARGAQATAKTRAAAASAAAQAATVVLVQPRALHFGQLAQGQGASATLTISGQQGGPVRGTIRPLAPWLTVDTPTFDGAQTQVTLRTVPNALTTPGLQQTSVQISYGSQHMYVPVSVEVQPVARRSRAQGRSRSAAPSKYDAVLARTPTPPPARRVRSFTLALGLALWSQLVVLQVLAMNAALPLALPLAFAVLVASAALTVPGALAGAGAPGWRQRLPTTLIGAALGLFIAISSGLGGAITRAVAHGTAASHLPGAALLLVAPGLAALGATVGADTRSSRIMLGIGAFVRRFAAAFITVGAVIAGAWGGFLLGAQLIYGLLAPIGMVLGAVVGALVAVRVNRLRRRTRTARAHP